MVSATKLPAYLSEGLADLLSYEINGNMPG
jgi:hypothetical protein